MPRAALRALLLGEGHLEHGHRLGRDRPEQGVRSRQLHDLLLGISIRRGVHQRVSVVNCVVNCVVDLFDKTFNRIPASPCRRANRDFGQRNLSVGKSELQGRSAQLIAYLLNCCDHSFSGGPYSITGLKAGFIYCADVTANNDCGHGPFCISCFENVVTLQEFN